MISDVIWNPTGESASEVATHNSPSFAVQEILVYKLTFSVVSLAMQ